MCHFVISGLIGVFRSVCFLLVACLEVVFHTRARSDITRAKRRVRTRSRLLDALEPPPPLVPDFPACFVRLTDAVGMVVYLAGIPEELFEGCSRDPARLRSGFYSGVATSR